MKKKILVTGANGHLGANTTRSLLTKGYAVKAFVRKTSDLMSLKDLGEMVNKLTGIRVPHLPFSRSINIAMGKMMELLAKTSGWDPPLTAGLAREYSHRFAQFDNSKMIKDFNYTPYSFEETIHDTIRWFSYLNKAQLRSKIADKFGPDTEWIASSKIV